MTGQEALFWTALAVVGIVGSALCSGLEMGLYSLSRVRLDLRASASPPDRAARMLHRELERPDRMLTTLLLGNNAFNYFGILGVTALLEGAGYSEAAVIAFSVLVVTPALLVVAESTPKEVFRVGADRLTPVFSAPLAGLRWVFTVTLVLPALLAVGRWAARMLGTPPGDSTGDARQRVAVLLLEGAGHGVLSESQSSLLDRALALRTARVGDEMVAWAGVRTIGADWPRGRVVAALAQVRHTRLPVVDGRGRVVGVLRQMDVFLRPRASVRELMTPVRRLDPGMSVQDALSVMRGEGAALAIVERGGRPLGVVTVKDLVEPLIGDIREW
ncbi:MAG: DUF21 domain-containing protein [Phycisphaerales bacterium]|nr:DUF21 domain-containing protein [Phycisphaerales bacterium]